MSLTEEINSAVKGYQELERKTGKSKTPKADILRGLIKAGLPSLERAKAKMKREFEAKLKKELNSL
jgi:hypothetical protein